MFAVFRCGIFASRARYAKVRILPENPPLPANVRKRLPEVN